MTFAQIPLQVETDKGVVEGALTNDDQVRAFKGIPFAAPPIGNLRWQPPQPAAKWKGVRPAKDFGSHCIQSGGYPDMVFHDPGPSEDCLTLNVWTPANAKPGTLPVMVWIFGGGFVTGGTSENRQDGQFLAHRNVVVVSMNYRLGIFGFFAHPELTAESPHHASGNYGLLDQTAALHWVKANIAAFGGDPNNVTIFGESAGSISVSGQMASPLARGLFAKAIGESGGALALSVPALCLASAAKSATSPSPRPPSAPPPSPTSASSPPTTSSKPPPPKPHRRRLASAPTSTATSSPTPSPASTPPATRPTSRSSPVGTPTKPAARSSWRSSNPPPPASPQPPQTDFGDNAQKFLALYPATTDAEAISSAGDYASDRFIAYSTWRWLEAQVATGKSPVYRYRFDLGSPGDKNHSALLGAFHSDDIEYVFGTLDSRPEAVWRPEDRKLSEQIGAYWTNFARTGDPNGPGLPEWPTYKPEQWQVMHLDATSEAKPDAQRDRYLFLDSVWGKPAPAPAIH